MEQFCFCVERVKRFVNFRLHCIVNDLKSINKISTTDAHGKGAWGHSNENLPTIAVRNTAQRSFSKLRLIKTFHRSTMSDKKLTNLSMISNVS